MERYNKMNKTHTHSWKARAIVGSAENHIIESVCETCGEHKVEHKQLKGKELEEAKKAMGWDYQF